MPLTYVNILPEHLDSYIQIWMCQEKGVKLMAFRVSLTEFKEFERIAAILNRKGKIRNDSVGSLARALCFVKINEFIQLEQMQIAAEAYEKGQQKWAISKIRKNAPPKW